MGEFRDPAEPIPAAQWMFLQAVERLVPDVLVELGRLAEVSPDEKRLREWAWTRRFSDKWLLRFARLTVELWRERPDTRGKFWRLPTSCWLPETAALACPVWDERTETEEAFDRRLADYKLAVRSAARARGDELNLPKRTRADEPIERHFEWLALYVVGNVSLDRIAERYPPADTDRLRDRSTISRGCHDAALRAGVTVK